jgi:hypothetical protein
MSRARRRGGTLRGTAIRVGGDVVLPCYEIRLSSADDTSAKKHFGDLTVTTDGDVVLMTGRLDQSALHGVLERIRVLRWRLLDVRRTRHLPRPC